MGNESSVPEFPSTASYDQSERTQQQYNRHGRPFGSQNYISAHDNTIIHSKSSDSLDGDEDGFDQIDGNDGRVLNMSERMRRNPSNDPHQSYRGRRQPYTGGSLKANLAAVERDNDSNKFVDPIISAAAAGAAARKAKRERAIKLHQQQLQQQQILEQQRRVALDNEWKSSLKRLASVAASTASTVAQAAAPVITDARKTVVGSAKEFVKDVKEEWKKEDSRDYLFDEESVYLYSTRSFDLSPLPHALEFGRMRSDSTLLSYTSLPTLRAPMNREYSDSSSVAPKTPHTPVANVENSDMEYNPEEIISNHSRRIIPRKSEAKDNLNDARKDDDVKVKSTESTFDQAEKASTIINKDSDRISEHDNTDPAARQKEGSMLTETSKKDMTLSVKDVAADISNNDRKNDHEGVHEGLDHPVVNTPYGKGLVIGTRLDSTNNITMSEIKLFDWNKAKTSSGGSQTSTSLFSPTKFPSVAPKVGDAVKTTYGRGSVIHVRDDGVTVVQMTSWKLAGGSLVTCYLSPDSEIQVMETVINDRNRPQTYTEGLGESLEVSQDEKKILKETTTESKNKKDEGGKSKEDTLGKSHVDGAVDDEQSMVSRSGNSKRWSDLLDKKKKQETISENNTDTSPVEVVSEKKVELDDEKKGNENPNDTPAPAAASPLLEVSDAKEIEVQKVEEADRVATEPIPEKPKRGLVRSVPHTISSLSNVLHKHSGEIDQDGSESVASADEEESDVKQIVLRSGRVLRGTASPRSARSTKASKEKADSGKGDEQEKAESLENIESSNSGSNKEAQSHLDSESKAEKAEKDSDEQDLQQDDHSVEVKQKTGTEEDGKVWEKTDDTVEIDKDKVSEKDSSINDSGAIDKADSEKILQIQHTKKDVDGVGDAGNDCAESDPGMYQNETPETDLDLGIDLPQKSDAEEVKHEIIQIEIQTNSCDAPNAETPTTGQSRMSATRRQSTGLQTLNQSNRNIDPLAIEESKVVSDMHDIDAVKLSSESETGGQDSLKELEERNENVITLEENGGESQKPEVYFPGMIGGNQKDEKEKEKRKFLAAWSAAMFEADEMTMFESHDQNINKNMTSKEGGSSERDKYLTMYAEKSSHNDLPRNPIKTSRLLENPKKLVDYLVTRLSGDGQEQKGKKWDGHIGPVEDHRNRSSKLQRSIFSMDEIRPSSRSLSPPGSPPEVPSVVQSDEESEFPTENINDEEESSLWDLVPARMLVATEPHKPSRSDEPSSNSRRKKRSLSYLFEKAPRESSSLTGNGSSQKINRGPFTSPESSAVMAEPARKLQRSRSKHFGPDVTTAKTIKRISSEGELDEQSPPDKSARVPIQVETTGDPASLTVGWDNNEDSDFPAVPDMEEMTEGFEKEEVLDEVLLAFSSLEDVDFLKNIPNFPRPETSKDFGPLIWRQLLSRWKHSEIWKAMISRPSSLHFRTLKTEPIVSSDSDTVSTTSTIQIQFHGRQITFPSYLSSVDTFSVFKNLSGFKPHSNDGEFMVLSGLLSELGPKSVSVPDVDDNLLLRQKLPLREKSLEKEESNDITELLKHAESHLEGFTGVVNSIVRFASLNDTAFAEYEVPEVTYSICLKNYSSVRRKAARRYNGDILQVKDILRGQITFPDEGSLVCGLYRLSELSRKSMADDKKQQSGTPKIEIVRFKNLFRTSDFGNPYFPALPSGYRHIIVNVRLNDTVIAELQLQLSQLYSVMGAEGYALHREIVTYGEKTFDDRRSSLTSQDKNVTGNDTIPAMLTTNLVESLIQEKPIRKENISSSAGNTANSNTVHPVATKGGEAMNPASSRSEKGATSSPSVTGGTGIAAATAAAAAMKQKSGTSNPIGGGGIAAAAAAAAATKDKMKTAMMPGGGIAAAAAAAASSKKTGSENAPPAIMGGGIAAAAAAAAAKKKTEAQPAGGGIAAAAAAAAAKKNSGHDAPAMGGGGIAAAAAAAAAKKKGSSSVVGGGGIAAAAAAAAQKKSTDNGPPAIGGGGIAAAAAAAANKKNKLESSGSNSDGGVAGGGGGIAAAAAAAAAKKNSGHDAPAMGGGGIAAAAAAAAAKKKESSSVVGGGGIAAAAAAAAQKKSADNGPPTIGGGGIAAAAAAAANKKNKLESSGSNSDGGIAAAAAAAAKKKESSGSGIAAAAAAAANRKSNVEESNPFGGGGIAAAAAAAAAKKTAAAEKNNSGIASGTEKGGGISDAAAEEVADKKTEKSSSLMSGGGIAAAAAAAAVKKVASAVDGGIAATAAAAATANSVSAAFGGGGIAAAAAQAAMAAAKKRVAPSESMVSPSEEDDEVAIQSLEKSSDMTKPTPGGGSDIAAAAAAAAAAKSSALTEKSDISSSMGGGGIAAAAAAAAAASSSTSARRLAVSSQTDGGGIAAAAAAAARDSTATRRAAISPQSDGGGIAAAAAAAARNSAANRRSAVSSQMNGGGIAAAAAAAAAAKSALGEQEANASVPIPSGGIAAAAAAAVEAKKSTVSHPPDAVAPMGGGGIAAAAAAAAAAKAQKVTSSSTEGGGGIAAAAAAAAAAKALKDPTPIAGGGIAAAATATAKESKTIPPMDGGGIAAAAAAAASRKLKASPQIGGGGIAAAAAAAAASKKASTSPPAGGGNIAAAAAAAAAAKGPKAPLPGGGGGIAAAAAAAAASKSSNAPMAGGGIAAAAAAAAASKSSKVSSPISDGGIATAAAAASKAVLPVVSTTIMQSEVSNEESCSWLNEHLAFDRVNGPSFLASVMQAGISEASSNPRDLPAFYCLYLLAKRLERLVAGNSGDTSACIPASAADDLKLLSQRLLLRSLAISNQATSIGMVGWLEYGSSNPLERTLSLPFEVLQRLACSFASENDWEKAADVLSSLVLRCEQHLPSYHPTTLSCLLDLAIAVSFAHGESFAKGIIQKASDLSACYLAEYEAIYFERCHAGVVFDNDGQRIFEYDDSVDAISMLKAYATGLREQLSRELLRFVGSTHEVVLLNHTFVGDALAVLANCQSAGAPAAVSGKKMDSPNFLRCWSMAYMHYQTALKGWINAHSLLHPNAVSVAYAVSRCLRGLGRHKEAISLLSTLASCLEETNTESALPDGKHETPKNIRARRFMFLNPNTRRRSIALQSVTKEQSLVMCVWQLAILTAELNPDEAGRIRALSLLHSASKAMKRVLDAPHELDENTRTVCLELYNCVEQEARNIFAPLHSIRLPEEQKLEVGNIPEQPVLGALTPMRQKRWQVRTQKMNLIPVGTNFV